MYQLRIGDTYGVLASDGGRRLAVSAALQPSEGTAPIPTANSIPVPRPALLVWLADPESVIHTLGQRPHQRGCPLQ